MDRADPSDPHTPGSVFRTVIIDDHELLRAGTRGILDEAPGFTVVGIGRLADEARRVVTASDPDLVITDIRLPTVNGIELAGQLIDEHSGLVVVVLSAYDDEHYVRAALAAGVSGYLLKTLPSHELVAALRAACSGAPDRSSLPHGQGEKDDVDRGRGTDERLTARESEVVGLVARGMSNKSIAYQLGISPRTVEGHLNHVFDKLGILSRTELVHFALARRLFVREPDGGDATVDTAGGP
jgi:DNA-binding NarL/FixJ family response regulator